MKEKTGTAIQELKPILQTFIVIGFIFVIILIWATWGYSALTPLIGEAPLGEYSFAAILFLPYIIGFAPLITFIGFISAFTIGFFENNKKVKFSYFILAAILLVTCILRLILV
jgi:hypothetical protein